MKRLFYFSVLFFALRSAAQPPDNILNVEKTKLLEQISSISSEPTIVDGLTHSVESKISHIEHSIRSDAALNQLEKEKAVRSIVYFLTELRECLAQQKLKIYDIPGALDSYENILDALIHHKQFAGMLTPLGSRCSQLLASAFTQYNGYALMDDIAVYKRVASAPEFILRFLENKPGYRFADSLLLIAAANDPMKIVSYLNGSGHSLKDDIRNSKNIYVQQIVSVSGNREASEILPFVTQMAEKEITPEEILEKRMDVIQYFQLLVNTLIRSEESKDPSFVFQKTLRNGIRQKALSFYVKQINDLHTSTDAVRFASVKDLRAEDIYYIITSCGEDLYTSSYLGLYKRMMARLNKQSADSIFNIVQYDNFRTFMRLAANYNVLVNFLSSMPWDTAMQLLKRFISGIESDTDSGLEKAMDIADCFTGIDSSEEIAGFIHGELQSNLDRCKSEEKYLGMRLYGILLQVFNQVKNKDDANKLWEKLGNYEMLGRDELKNKNGQITELVLFYGDEDGTASFNNFQKLFSDKKRWEITRNEYWITIRSLGDEPVVIYANLPLNSKDELDVKAQDLMISFLEQQSIDPTVLIHRGHSYHLAKTLQRLKPSVRLAILGSCGGYNSAISIATINPDVQIIGSKKTGSKSINDPIIDVINETLLNKQDISWPEIWAKLQARFRKDEFTQSLFDEYIPPGKNVSLFVLKLFNRYGKSGSFVINNNR